uniref:Arif-1 n=1 Tax=Spodoptera littoralis nuclear polyhedrosis virus TaxID=10456 RepID=A0A3G4S929_NPVSL|nr:arif-1 [Spodoptera littoralis nucleopolyhedrovirus]
MSALTKTVHLALIVFMLSTASLCVAFGILGVIDERFEPTLDYENGTGPETVVYLMLAYGSLLALVTVVGSIGYFSRIKRFMHVAVPIAVFLAVLQISMFMSIASVSQHLHLPIADAAYRDHDKNSVCWTGLERRNFINDTSNCCVRKMMCVECRSEYVCDEMTFAKRHYWTLFVLVAASVMANFLFIQNMFDRLCRQTDGFDLKSSQYTDLSSSAPPHDIDDDDDQDKLFPPPPPLYVKSKC